MPLFNDSSTPHLLNTTLNQNRWLALTAVFALVIFVRETFLFIATVLGVPTIGNILGMVFLLIALLLWRFTKGMPNWLTQASNTLLTESALAYLPACAGAGLILFKLGDDFFWVMLVTFIATVPPLWILAKLASYWLHHESDGSYVDDFLADAQAQDAQAKNRTLKKQHTKNTTRGDV